MTPAPGCYVMVLSSAYPSADTLAALFEARDREAVKTAFADVTCFLEPGRMVLLPGLVPALKGGTAPDRTRYARGEVVLALRGCKDGQAELWLVYTNQRFEALADAQQCAKGLALASGVSYPFSVFRLTHHEERLH